MIPLLYLALLAPPPSPIELPKVMVRGDRYVEDDAAPSTVIDREAIDTEAVADLPQLLDEQPGLRTTRLGGIGAFSTVSVRGSTPDQVLVLIDGIPLNSSEGGAVDLSAIPLGPVDAIVVYRGVTPLGAMSSAIGGTVSVHTRALSGHWLELEAGGGSFGTRSARGFYGTGGDKWAVGLSVDYLGSEGDYAYLNDGGTLLGGGASEDDAEVKRANNAFDRVSVMAKGSGQLTDALSLTGLALFTWRDRGLPGLGVHPTESAALTQMRALGGLSLKGRWGAASLSVTPFVSASVARLSDPQSEVGLGKDDTDDVALVTGVNALSRWSLPLDAEGAYVMTPGLAAGWRFEDFEPGGQSTSAIGQPASRQLVNAAAELSTLLGPADLEVVASARFEAALSAQSGESATDTAWTWRAALVQTSVPQTSFKLNVSQAVRFPSLFELYGNTGAVLGNPGLKPERGLNLDLGVVHAAEWEGAALGIELFGFLNHIDDLIQLVQNSQGVAVAQNLAEARVAGVELGAYFDVLSHLRGRTSVTWMHTEDLSDVAASAGKQLPGRPEWKVFARLSGYHDFGSTVSEVGLSVDMEYLSGNHMDAANLVGLDDRVLLGASAWAGFLDDQLRAKVSVHNILSDRVVDLVGFPLPGLTALASLSYQPRFSAP